MIGTLSAYLGGVADLLIVRVIDIFLAFPGILLAIALAVVNKCEPCVKLMVAGARKAGVSDEEIGEAVALGISFGGADVNMFYQQLRM